MIKIKQLTKRFDKVVAVDGMTLDIASGTVLGLVGSNGSGKSTLLRMLSGVFAPDGGEILIDGEKLFDNPAAKGKCYFIPDFPYFYNDSTVENTASLLRDVYPNWSENQYEKYCSVFPIDRNVRILNMSKGMQRQAALILALSTRPSYLFLDEIFDGLDPVIRQHVKKIIIENVTDRKMTVMIASHNLRELEDICDHIGMLHKGGVVEEKELDTLKLGIHKVQIAFNTPIDESVFDGLDVINKKRQGSLFSLTIRGDAEDFMPKLEALEPAFLEALPLTLEEVFINEMEGVGYDINNIN